MNTLEEVLIALRKAATEGKETAGIFKVEEETVMAIDGMGVRTLSTEIDGGFLLICYTTGVIV